MISKLGGYILAGGAAILAAIFGALKLISIGKKQAHAETRAKQAEKEQEIGDAVNQQKKKNSHYKGEARDKINNSDFSNLNDD